MLFDGGGKGGFQTVQMLGMINALKTGDPTTDTMIAMLLPFVLTKITAEVGRYGKDLWMRRFKIMWKRSYKRSISHRVGGRTNPNTTNSTTMDEDSYNCFLIKAIKLYIHKHCKFDMEEVDLELIDPNSLNVVNGGGGGNTPQRRQLRRAYENTRTNSASTYGMLQNCSIIQRPIKQRWHNVGVFDDNSVKIMMMESTENGTNRNNNSSGDSESTPAQTFELRLESDGASSIDSFVEKAYSWYLEELRKGESNDRYLYDLRGFDGRASHKSPVYGRYTLGDEKTFASLFSKQCHSLLEVVDQFQSKTGKYAVPGYPYKLGLLLHGPPGSGKTSFIKALAHYTDRHIVNVPLARIQTNQELMTLMFNNKFNVPGDPKPASLSFEQVIYVFEDIDAASDVVMRRDARKEKSPTTDVVQAALPPGRRAPAAGNLPPGVFPSTASRPTFGGLDGDDLNLTGILNALDGVVDTPGRIVIMTTNHPEMLDPALIRPGRIDKKLELSYMHQSDVVAMVEHYYQTRLSDFDKERVIQAVTGGKDGEPLKLVPAHVEQRSMDEDTVGAMIEWLEKERERLLVGRSVNDDTVTDTEESSAQAGSDSACGKVIQGCITPPPAEGCRTDP
jgi:chaperone BCS1